MTPTPPLSPDSKPGSHVTRLWEQARNTADAQQKAGLLRQLQTELLDNPHLSILLWAAFLDLFLNPDQLDLLNQEDALKVETMADRMEKHGLWIRHQTIQKEAPPPISRQTIGLRLLKVYDRLRNVPKSVQTLVSLYHAPTSGMEQKMAFAVALAQRKVCDNDAVTVYTDALIKDPAAPQKKEIVSFLREICDVHFASGPDSIKRAGEVASALDRQHVPGIPHHRAMGMHALLVERNYNKALASYQSALKDDPEDRAAFAGLVAAHLEQGSTAQALQLAGNFPDTPVAHLGKLARTMAWLDDCEAGGKPPSTSAELEAYSLGRFAPTATARALGRLHLLEGNCQSARNHLDQITEAQPQEYRWHYYAAWADALSGDAGSMLKRWERAAAWEGRWTIACLWMDAEADASLKIGLGSFTEKVPQRHQDIWRVRLALAQSRQPPPISWQNIQGTLEEKLESLRVQLGYAFYLRDQPMFAEALGSPLFDHLPVADQTLWRGLDALLVGDSPNARGLLKRAAVDLRNRRAALLLLVHFLENGEWKEARDMLQIAEQAPFSNKLKLLRIYFDEAEGKYAQVDEQIEFLVRETGDARAFYALGNIRMHRSDLAMLAKDQKQAEENRQQALTALNQAINQPDVSLPPEAAAVKVCFEFLSDPAGLAAAAAAAWKVVQELAANRRRPWFMWCSGIARCLAGDGTSSDNPLALLIDDLERNPVGDATIAVEIIGRMLLESAFRAKTADAIDPLVQLFPRLEALAPSLRLNSVGNTVNLLQTRLAMQGASKDAAVEAKKQMEEFVRSEPHDVKWGFFSAESDLAAGRKDDALRVLRALSPADDFSKKLVRVWLAILGDENAADADPPEDDETMRQALRQAVQMLGAVVHFRRKCPDRGYEALLKAAKNMTWKRFRSLFLVENCIPSFTVQAQKRGSVPADFPQILRELGRAVSQPREHLVLGRCAALVGDLGYALDQWDRFFNGAKQITKEEAEEYMRLLNHAAFQAHRTGNMEKTVFNLYQSALISLRDDHE